MPKAKAVSIVGKLKVAKPVRVPTLGKLKRKVKRQTPAQRASNAIAAKYNSLGGSQGWLKAALTPVKVCPDKIGYFRHFKGGSIYYHPKTGAHAVKGLIRSRWAEDKWERGDLGYPTTDEEVGRNADGEGRFTIFQGGAIFWTKELGAVLLEGAIWEKYRDLGAEASALGFPKQEAKRTPRRGGRFVHFEFGSIYYTLRTGAWEVHGAIRGFWANAGWERNEDLGFPISDELIPDRAVGWRKATGVSIGRRMVLGQAVRINAEAVKGVGAVRTNAIAAKPKLTPNPALSKKVAASLLVAKPMVIAPSVLETLNQEESENRYNDFENGVVFWNRHAGKARMLNPWKKTKSGASMIFTAPKIGALLQAELVKRVQLPACVLTSVAYQSVTGYSFDGAGVSNRKQRFVARWRGSIPIPGRKSVPADIVIRLDVLVSWNPLHRSIDMAICGVSEMSVPARMTGLPDVRKTLGQKMDPLLWQRIKVADVPVMDGDRNVAVLSVKTMSNGFVHVYREPKD